MIPSVLLGILLLADPPAAAPAAESLRALVERGRALDRKGLRAEADALFATFPARTLPEGASAEERTALALGCQEQALRSHDKALLKRVMSELYTQAQAADPAYAPARIEAGRLFSLKHQYGQALEEFEAVLKADPKNADAWAGTAGAVWGRGDFLKAQQACAKALEASPGHEEATLLLAMLSVWDEEDVEAARLAGEALARNPGCLEAEALLAALAHLRGDAEEGGRRLRRLEALCPGWPEAFRILASAFESRHRSRDSIAWLERGLRIHPEDPGLLSDLGTILVHQSREPEGVRLLERAYALDPFDSRVSNMLNLLDEVSQWPEIRTAHFRIRCHPGEAELLGPLLAKSLERDYEEITALFGYEPGEQPIQVEMYPEQSDFAVRTIGQPSLGALGVCFGRFMAVDSPAVQAQVEPFHWADVARHEFAHVVTLQMTDFRIPRWLTEGLSVYCERHPRLPFEAMLKGAAAAGRILPMAKLNKAFSRPEFPGQVQLAYAQGGRIAKYVAETRGFSAIRDMLRAYRKGRDTPAVFREVLGLSLEEFDREFGVFLAAELSKVQALVPMPDPDVKALEGKPGNELELARQFLLRRKWAEAERWASKAEGPEAKALLGTARVHLERLGEAEAPLREAVAGMPGHYLGHQGLGDFLAAAGKPAEAVASYRKARTLYPHALGAWRGEADACFTLGRLEEGIAALKALSQANPLDTPSRLDLARALRDGGKAARALEVLDEGLLADVQTPDLHRLRFELLSAMGRKAEAAEALGMLALAHPKDAEAAKAAAAAWRAAGDEAKALRFENRKDP